MQRTDIVHHRRADYHQRADHERAVHVGQCQPQVCLQALARLLLELADLKFLAPKRVHHPDRAQSLLRLSEDSAFLFLNGCRFTPNPMGKEINGADNQRNYSERNQRKLPIQSQHNQESSDQRDDRAEDVGESLVVNRLDRLRVVRHAETGITRTPCVVVFKRERLQVRVQIGAELKQSLQSDFHEQIICNPIDNSPEKLNTDQRQAQQQNPEAPVGTYRWSCTQKIVNDNLERPRLEQVQAYADKRQAQSEDRLCQERPVVAENAPVDRHENLGLGIFVFRLN